MQSRRTLTLGQKGAKDFLERYGEQLICVRYPYDEQRRSRFTTVEIIVEESGWSPPQKPEIVGLRVIFMETPPLLSARSLAMTFPSAIAQQPSHTERLS